MKETGKQLFEEAYARLNPEQKRAVDAIEGPVMVIAGPGTGKTEILTLRIANILKKTDTRPENILALTFTEAGVRAMRTRLTQYLGAEAYRVAIHTFHGFAETLIRQYPDAYARVVGGRPATDIEKIDLMQSIIDGGAVRLLRPIGDPAYYTTKVLSTISTLKREYVAPDTFAEIIERQEARLSAIAQYHEKGAHKGKVRGEYARLEKSIAKNRELLWIYRQYEAALTDRRLYDFEDMILETVRALEGHEDMLRDVQETYLYLLADEHQDVNGSQNRILELLASYHEQPNLFVVGDEKQAIFRFQGASLENFLYFGDAFTGTESIALSENYRSGQEILDVSHALIAVDEGPAKALRIPLHARAGAPQAHIERRVFSHQAVEDAWVVRTVEHLHADGIPLEEIAVIVRTNREVEALATHLRKRGIAVAPSADSDILDHPVTQSVQQLLDAVSGDREDALFAVLHGPYWGISAEDLTRVLAARSMREPLSGIIRSRQRLTDLSVSDPEKVLKAAQVLDGARRAQATHAPHEVLERLLVESGFLQHVTTERPIEGARVIRRLYDEIEAMVYRDRVGTLTDISTVLARRRTYGLPLTAPFIALDTQAVPVLTAHKAKGLEFAAVIIPHLVDSVWGGGTKRTYFDIPLTRHLNPEALDAEDDERRLFYVAMTRAKQRLFFSSARTNAEGREFVPTRLLSYIEDVLPSEADTSSEEAAFDPADTLVRVRETQPSDPSFLRAAFLERGLSATALDNYLASPWTYFYRNVLRVPEVRSESLLYGSAMHEVLDRTVWQYVRAGARPSDTEVLAFLSDALGRLPLTTETYTHLHEKGSAALVAYLTHSVPNLSKRAESEFAIHVSLPTGDPELPEVPLTGKLDRLDFDDEGRVVRIIDYKTGKPKSRNDIEGKTKNSRGNYKRQLVFYALLLSLLEDERYACREGVISFLEPDRHGTIREETFTVSDAEIADLRMEIIQVSKEIVSGAFLTTPCDPTECDYCEYAERFRTN